MADLPEPAMTSGPGRLLVISYHSPAAGTVGGLRWWGLSRHLALRGWRVHLVTAQAGASNPPIPEGMTVEGVSPRTTLDERYRSWKRARQRAGSPPPGPPEMANRPTKGRMSRSLRALRKEIGGVLSVPDEARGWLLRAHSAARSALSELRPTAVVSTGPPHSVHLVTGLALRGRKVRWIADFRDPWMDEADLHLDLRWAAPIFSRMERYVARSADRVLTTTPELAHVLARRFPAAEVRCLPNGVELAALPKRAPDRSRGFTLVHLGTLYHRRDPEPAVRAFALFLRRNPDAAAAGSALHFVGRMGAAYGSLIDRVAKEEGIGDHVKSTGVQPREEALRILAGCGASVVLAQDQGTAVPAKIYEAVGMGVPTLVVTEAGSATAEAGLRLGAAVHDGGDLEGMARALEAAWENRWDGGPRPGTRLDYSELAEDLEPLLLGG